MKTLCAALLLLPLLAQAGDADLLACSRVPEAPARLACYDALAARLARAPETAPVVTGKATPAAEAGFGAQPKPNAELDAIQSQIMGDFEGWGPRTVFTLANGQRWMVVDDSRAVVYRKDPKVTIRRAAMGSFWFEVQGSKSAAKVRRVD